MKKFILWHDGDKDTGIPGERAEVVFDPDSIAGHSAEIGQSHVAHVRIVLKDAFQKLWDFPVKVNVE
mgnify:CR=1 FL=1